MPPRAFVAVTVLATALLAVPNARAATLTDAKISEFVANNNGGIVPGLLGHISG